MGNKQSDQNEINLFANKIIDEMEDEEIAHLKAVMLKKRKSLVISAQIYAVRYKMFVLYRAEGNVDIRCDI